MGTFTERLAKYPFETRNGFVHNNVLVCHYKSKDIVVQELNGIMTIIRIDIDGNGNWWYLTEFQACFVLDNSQMKISDLVPLFKFEYGQVW